MTASQTFETLTVVVPVYNERDVLPEFYSRLSTVLRGLALKSEIVFVDDGSSDGTLETLLSFREPDLAVTVIELTRNFGKERALSAGLDNAEGDAVAIIDADLQDPPELIGPMLEELAEGYDAVYARRTQRKGETRLKRLTASWFYRIIGRMTPIDIPPDTGDFRVLSRRAVLALRTLGERNRFMKGLYAWIGYPQKEFLYDREPRHAGRTKWNYWKLWNFALDGITSFSTVPLRAASYVGFVLAMASLGYGVWVVMKKILFGDPVAGYPSLMAAILFLGGVQLTFMGVIGEYLGRIFTETKARPLYMVSRIHRAGDKDED